MVYTLYILSIMKTVINIKTEKEIKREAQKVAQELGFSLSAIINAQLRQLIKEKETYFSVTPKMTLYLEKVVNQAREDYKNRKRISPVFSFAKEALDHLHSK